MSDPEPPTAFLASAGGVVLALIGYLARQAHTSILEKLDALEARITRHVEEDEELDRTIAVQQATIAEKLGNLLERVRDLRDHK